MPRIALEKLGGHIVPLSVALLVTFVSIAIAGSAYPVLPGDEISVTSAFAYSIWLGLVTSSATARTDRFGPDARRGRALRV